MHKLHGNRECRTLNMNSEQNSNVVFKFKKTTKSRPAQDRKSNRQSIFTMKLEVST